MTKADIVYHIREKIGTNHDFKKREVSYKVILNVLERFFDVIKDNLSNGEHIELRGFGTFETKIREPKRARNPKTKEIITGTRHAIPVFKAGKELKKTVRESFDKKIKK